MGTLLAERVKKERAVRGLTQEALGKVLNVGKGTVSTWETGEKIPQRDTELALRQFFGISADEMEYLVLDGRIPDPDAPEELRKRLRMLPGTGTACARNLARDIMARAEKKGAPHNHYAEMFLSSLLIYISDNIPESSISLNKVLELTMESEVSERNEALESPLDRRFATLEKKDKIHPAVSAYNAWKMFPVHDKKTSIGLAQDALMPLAEWERESCREYQEYIALFQAEMERIRAEEKAQRKHYSSFAEAFKDF